MAHLSAVQIARHAYRAGFRAHALTTAVAVALAESNGDPTAHNAVPPDNSYGLWQVNMIGALGPDRRQEFGLKSNDQLFNPDRNAHAAWEISDHGHDFRPWSTFTNGAYTSHLAAARHAEQTVTKNHGATGGGKGGHLFVEPQRLHHYAQQVSQLGHGLTETSAKVKQAGAAIKADTLGAVAGDGGFSTALREFLDVYDARIKQAGSACDELGKSVARTAAAYQATEDHTRAGFTTLQA